MKYPVYPNDSYSYGIDRVLTKLIQYEETGIQNQFLASDYFAMIREEMKEEHQDYVFDVMTS